METNAYLITKSFRFQGINKKRQIEGQSNKTNQQCLRKMNPLNIKLNSGTQKVERFLFH